MPFDDPEEVTVKYMQDHNVTALFEVRASALTAVFFPVQRVREVGPSCVRLMRQRPGVHYYLYISPNISL
jgi:hypothetical protein